jgi:hypothetical protein
MAGICRFISVRLLNMPDYAKASITQTNFVVAENSAKKFNATNTYTAFRKPNHPTAAPPPRCNPPPHTPPHSDCRNTRLACWRFPKISDSTAPCCAGCRGPSSAIAGIFGRLRLDRGWRVCRWIGAARPGRNSDCRCGGRWCRYCRAW